MDEKSSSAPPPPPNYDAPPPSYTQASAQGMPPPVNPAMPAPVAPGYPQQQAGQPMQQPAYGQPQQPGYPQAGYGQPVTSATTVVVTQPGAVVVGGRMGPNPCNTTCPYCRANVTTAVSRSCGGFVWMIAGIICLIGCFAMGITWLGCCLIPFCIPSLYDATHTCPNCGKIIGQHTHF